MSYEEKVKRIKKAFAEQKGNVGLGKKTSNLYRDRNDTKKKKIDVSDLTEIINFDTKHMTVEVEGMCPYEKIVQKTLPLGFIPAFCPELRTITVGGEIAGIGVESSGFRYGFAHETVLEFDVLTGEGKVITCSPKEHSDLYYGFANTYGTLGYVLRAKLLLVPAKKYVEITRTKYTDAKSYVAEMERLAKTYRDNHSVDYIDGLVFAKDEMYIVIGRFTDDAPFTSDYRKEIYYKSFQTKEKDYVTTYDYLFRYDFDWFWCSKYFGLENKFIRMLWGKKRLHSGIYNKIMRWNAKHKVTDKIRKIIPVVGGKQTESLIQDFEVPVEQAAEFINFMLDEVGIVPMTAAPIQSYKKTPYTMFAMDPETIYINVGFYDSFPSTKPEGYYLKKIEKKAQKMKLKKMLYSLSYMNQEEFWDMFDEKGYNILKKTYDPNNTFLGIYEKCVQRK